MHVHIACMAYTHLTSWLSAQASLPQASLPQVYRKQAQIQWEVEEQVHKEAHKQVENVRFEASPKVGGSIWRVKLTLTAAVVYHL